MISAIVSGSPSACAKCKAQNRYFVNTCIAKMPMAQIEEGFTSHAKLDIINTLFKSICHNYANTKWTVFKHQFHTANVSGWKGLTQHKTHNLVSRHRWLQPKCFHFNLRFFYTSQTSKLTAGPETRWMIRHMELYYCLVLRCRKITTFYILQPPLLIFHTLTCSCLMDSDFSEHFLSEHRRFSWHWKRLCSAAQSNSG